MMITVNGQNIDHYSYHQKASKVFRYSDLELEERQAAQYCGYTWNEYIDLPGSSNWIDPENPSDDKSSIVVFYRRMRQMESVSNDFKPPVKKR